MACEKNAKRRFARYAQIICVRACVGAGLARGASTVVYQAHRGDAIAGKPAPTQAGTYRGMGLAYGAFEAAHAGQFQHQFITHFQRAHAHRRTSQDHVTGL